MEEVSKFFLREILLLKSRKLGKKKSKSEVERKTREVWVESRRVASRLANWAPGIEPQTFATLDPVLFSLSIRECFLTTEQTLNLFTTTKRLTGNFFLQYQYAIQWGGGDKAIFNSASILSPTNRWRQSNFQFSVGRNQELLSYGFLRFVIGRENLRHPPNQSGAEQRHLWLAHQRFPALLVACLYCFYFELSLAKDNVNLSSDWSLWLLWFWFIDCSIENSSNRQTHELNCVVLM